MSEAPNGNESFMTVREMVSEIRKDIKEMRADAVSKDSHADHERRIRGLEKWKYGIPVSALLAIGTALLSASH